MLKTTQRKYFDFVERHDAAASGSDRGTSDVAFFTDKALMIDDLKKRAWRYCNRVFFKNPNKRKRRRESPCKILIFD